MGIGNHACEAVSEIYYENENPAIDFITITSNREVLRSFLIPSENKIYLTSDRKNNKKHESQSNSKHEPVGEGLVALEKLLTKNYQLIFILTTLDGETGTALSKMIAERSAQTDALIISIIAYPYYLKGKLHHFNVESGLNALSNFSDTLFLFSNDRSCLFQDLKETQNIPIPTHSLFMQPVEVILSMISLDGSINIDFNDMETAIKGTNKPAAILNGLGQGKERIAQILTAMYQSPYLAEIEWSTLNTIIICFESGYENEIQVNEIAQVMDSFQNKFSANPEFIWGNCTNPNLSGAIRVSAVLTQQQAE
ncbi:hypothetical protein [uncultured Sunxiuqinia sp.]|uniref:hypothetical protein n=1 Tax=uncultured Sunxiuqinia sp. TaxID=1573825 RepID=UPI0026172ED4|nr:hypothetical protein [uncultured Sunxiuqinia sp.]